MTERKKGEKFPYDKKTAEKYCEYLEKGMSIKEVCEIKGMPSRHVVTRWRKTNNEFAEMFDLAYDNGTDHRADSLENMVDDAVNEIKTFSDPKLANAYVCMCREKFHNLRYLLSIRNPKKYSMKIASEVTGSGDKPVAVNVTLNTTPVEKKGPELTKKNEVQ